MAPAAATVESKSIVGKVRDKLQPAKEKDQWGRVTLPNGDTVTPASAKLLNERPGSEYIGCELRTVCRVKDASGRFENEELFDPNRHSAANIVPDSKRVILTEYLRVPPNVAVPPFEAPGQLQAGEVNRDTFWRAKDGSAPGYVGFTLSTAALRRCSRTGTLSPAGTRLFLSGMGPTIKQLISENEEQEGDEERK